VDEQRSLNDQTEQQYVNAFLTSLGHTWTRFGHPWTSAGMVVGVWRTPDGELVEEDVLFDREKRRMRREGQPMPQPPKLEDEETEDEEVRRW
jgi:hypothetical protein